MKQRSARANSFQFRARRARPPGSRRQSPFLLAERGDCRPISPELSLAARQRLNQIERYLGLVRSGNNQTNAARQVGFSRSAAFRWIKRYEANGLAGLAPQLHGRRPLVSQCGVTADVLQKLCRAVVAAGNIPRGFRIFAQSPACPPPLARVIRRSKAIPASLRHLVALQPVHFTGLRAGDQIVLLQKGGRA